MEENILKALKEGLPNLQQNVLLKDHTTFKIGGPAAYFLETGNKEEILKAITLAKKLKVPFFILGGGSNLLVSDKGFSGLVINVKSNKGMRLVSPEVIEADAGLVLGDLVSFSIENSLEGLEWAGGLPGTLGGAIRGNAGAFGGEIKDSVLEVEALDETANFQKLSNAQCNFSYRSSIFKEKGWMVISAKLQFKKGDKEELLKIATSRIAYRKERHPLEYPNAGSVFKNVDFKKVSPEVQKIFLDKVKKDPFEIIPSAWLIIEAGLKGKKIGQAQISEKHSNYIVNLGGAKAEDVLNLITLVKEKIKQMYGITLETEVQYIE